MMIFRLKAAATILALLFVLCIGAGPCLSKEGSLTGKDILDRVDDLYRGKSSRGIMTMYIVTEHWERTLKMEWWSKGNEKSLIRILAPEKEKGTATLRSGNEIYNYLPKVKRVIKLPSSMMSASWMGSHFTNDDLVKESRMAEDYTFTITFEGERGGREIIEITCIPKPDAPVVWGKVLVTVTKEDLLPVKIEYFDEDLNLARTMIFKDIGPLGEKTLPREVVMLPEDKPGEKTVVRYEEFDFNVDLTDEFFSLRNLTR